jgi:hypothetical protein
VDHRHRPPRGGRDGNHGKHRARQQQLHHAARDRHGRREQHKQLDIHDACPHRREEDGAPADQAVREGAQRHRGDQPARQADPVVQALQGPGEDGHHQARATVHEHPQGRELVHGQLAGGAQDLRLPHHPPRSQVDRQGDQGQLREPRHRDRHPRSEAQAADQAGRRVPHCPGVPDGIRQVDHRDEQLELQLERHGLHAVHLRAWLDPHRGRPVPQVPCTAGLAPEAQGDVSHAPRCLLGRSDRPRDQGVVRGRHPADPDTGRCPVLGRRGQHDGRHQAHVHGLVRNVLGATLAGAGDDHHPRGELARQRARRGSALQQRQQRRGGQRLVAAEVVRKERAPKAGARPTPTVGFRANLAPRQSSTLKINDYLVCSSFN